jgi:hypothetical protein
MYELFSKLKEYFKRKEREAYLRKYGFDNRCPCCKRWQGNCGGVQAVIRSYPTEEYDAYKCGGCDKWFILDTRGMIQTVAADQSAARKLDGDTRND